MSVTVYRNTDASAPVLTGTAGDLTNLLDKCLVSGYGAKAAAGWSKPFVGGAGQAVFRPGSGVQHYFNIDDGGSGLGGAKEAPIRGYETMTAFATGTGLFPTTAQSATSMIIRKSATADATARNWIVIADDRTAHVLVASGDQAGYYYANFGELYSVSANPDNYRSIVQAGNQANNPQANQQGGCRYDNGNGSVAVRYAARSYTGGGTALVLGGWYDLRMSNMGTNDQASKSSILLGADPISAQHLLSPWSLHELGVGIRGRDRGHFQPLARLGTYADGDTISPSAGPYSGRTFLIAYKVVCSDAAGNTTGGTHTAFDITGPWETN